MGDSRWVPEHNKRRIMDAYAPVRAPVAGGNPLPSKRTNSDASVNAKTVADIAAQSMPDAAKDPAALEAIRQLMGQGK